MQDPDNSGIVLFVNIKSEHFKRRFIFFFFGSGISVSMTASLGCAAVASNNKYYCCIEQFYSLC